jgi:membrane protein involved in colicin uptake
MGTPAASIQLAPGAGHGEAGDAPSQGPAREEVLSASPKSANPDKLATSSTAPVIELAHVVKPETVETRDLVTTRPKPEKRKNAKERAKDKFSKDKTAEDGTTPMTVTAKSEADVKAKAERKAETKAASKAAKAERKRNRSAGKRAAAKAA